LKKLLICLVLLFGLILSSCSVKNDKYEVAIQDKTFLIDTVNKTILHEGQIYKYDINGPTITITYPDNSKYWWTQQANGGYGGMSDNYDESKYVPGNILIEALTYEIPTTNKSGKNYFLGFILLALGIWSTVSPYSVWYLRYGWIYENAEPSDVAIELIRIGGLFIILVGVIFIFV